MGSFNEKMINEAQSTSLVVQINCKNIPVKINIINVPAFNYFKTSTNKLPMI